MPKIAKELTVLEIKRLGQGTFAIGGVKGLYIRKTPTQTLLSCATATPPEGTTFPWAHSQKQA